MTIAIRAGLAVLLAGVCLVGGAGAEPQRRPATPPSAQDIARRIGPIIPGAHFHHIHLNVTDREAAIAFYVKHFKAVRGTFAGEPAVWTQRSWILFNEVKEAPAKQQGTAINHMGWGAPDAPKEFERQKALGATFDTELRDISTGLGGKPGQFYFMYVRGPDGAQIELNTDPDDNFGHIHIWSADPILANHWYRNMFGVVDAPPYFSQHVTPPNAGAIARSFLDNINLILIKAPANTAIRSTRGSVTDHIAISVPNLDAALKAVRTRNVPVLEEAGDGPGKAYRRAMIEGPDKMAIELIEDHSPHPPVSN